MDVLVVLLNSGVSQVTCLHYIDLTIFTGGTVYPSVGQSLIDYRKLEVFLGGRLMDLMCWDNTLLMWLKVNPT
jgi:hypothetical protein